MSKDTDGNDLITNSPDDTTGSTPSRPVAPQPKSVDEQLEEILDKFAPLDEYDHDMIDPMWERNLPKLAQALLAWNEASNKAAVVEAYKKGYIDGGIGVINGTHI